MKGHCEHGEFELAKGCPQCMAEKQKDFKAPEPLSEEARQVVTAGRDVMIENATKPENEIVENDPDHSKAEQVNSFEVAITTAMTSYSPDANVMVAGLRGKIAKALKYAQALAITSQEDVKSATNDLVLIGQLTKALENERQYYAKPLNSRLKDINVFFKELAAPVIEANQVTRNHILAYNVLIESQRAEAERIEDEKLELAQAEMRLKGEHTIDLTEVEKPEATPDRVRADVGMVSKTDVWKYEVFDFALLPDEYKVADTALLNATVKKNHDTKQIAGVRIYAEPSLRVSQS